MNQGYQLPKEIFQGFLNELRTHSENLKLKYIVNDKELLASIFTDLNKMKTARDSFRQQKASHFNIFSVLRYGHYETRLHTPFLVHLLDPNESHELGSKLLLPFVNKVFTKNWEEAQLENISVIEELESHELNGRIDVFIKFKIENDWHFIAVENKINANDQEMQLSRYYDYLMTHTTNKDKVRLVYLTKDGRDPSDEKTISFDLLNELKGNSIYLPLSHRNDISKLIENLIITSSDRVKETLKQYLLILKNF